MVAIFTCPALLTVNTALGFKLVTGVDASILLYPVKTNKLPSFVLAAYIDEVPLPEKRIALAVVPGMLIV